MKKTHILTTAIALGGLLGFTNVSNAQVITNSTTTTVQILTEAPSINWPKIEAKSAFVYNPVSNTVIFEKDADTQRSTASLLKIMTAMTADNILAKNPKLEEKSITVVNMKEEAPSDFALPAKSKWSPDSLLKIMLLGSSNKAAETLASGLIPRSSFISLMNYNAKRLGLTKTYFRNPSGLTEPTKATITAGRLDVAAGVSTAREMAKLMWAGIAENPGLLDITRSEALAISNPTVTLKGNATSTIIANTNKILKDFPIMFSKTGFTENSGGNLAVVMQKDELSQPYIIVVLGSTAEKRFEDVAKLASTTLLVANAKPTTVASK